MPAPAISVSEAERIDTLRNLLILDTAPGARFDLITAYAATQFDVSIALVSLVGSDRQWFKSSVEFDTCETPRENRFCRHALWRDEILEIRDTALDPRIRFYAGCPLVMANGHAAGTLCLIGRPPRRLNEWERGHLGTLAKMVAAELQGLSTSAIEDRPNIPGYCG